MSRYRIHHRTTYRYRYPVLVSHHAAHLEPLQRPNQHRRSFQLNITPEPFDLSSRLDYFGNRVHHFSIQEDHDRLVVDSHSEVVVTPPEAPLQEMTPTPREVSAFFESQASASQLSAYQFCFPSQHTPESPEVLAWAAPFFPPQEPVLQGALRLAEHLAKDFTFDARATDVSTPIQDVLKHRRGVCQDFAHLMLAGLRALRLPACYVSGYILTQPPPGKPRLVGADASHAWVSVYLPHYGWVDIDPTNFLICTDQHVTVSRGRDYADVSLVRGAVTGGGEHSLDVEVTMSPLEAAEAPEDDRAVHAPTP